MSSAPSDFKRYSKQAVLVRFSDIIIKDRVRGEDEFGHVKELAESIRTEGLLHPPVLDADNKLIAGECRIRAMRDELKWDMIPVQYLETMDDAHLARLENEENFKRSIPSWKMRVKSIAKTHRRMALQNALVSSDWGQKETGKLLNISQASVSHALLLVDYIEKNDKEICAASTASDALRILLDRKEKALNAALVKQTTTGPVAADNLLNTPLGAVKTPPSVEVNKTAEELDAEMFGTVLGSPAAQAASGVFAPGVGSVVVDSEEMPGGVAGSESPLTCAPSAATVIPLSTMFRNVDGARLMVDLGYESVDHVICDLPYGVPDHMDIIKQENGGQDIEHTRAGHDSEENLRFYDRLFPNVYDALRTGGFFIAWYDLEHHEYVMNLGRQCGFKVQAWPLIWNKTHRCVNKQANVNFTKSHETAFVMRKGSATLLSPQDRSVWTGSNELEAKALGHAFAKPFKLWQWIYDAVVQRGQTVADPCVGCGSSTIAALERGLRPVGSELLEADYHRLLINIQNWYKVKDPTVQFS